MKKILLFLVFFFTVFQVKLLAQNDSTDFIDEILNTVFNESSLLIRSRGETIPVNTSSSDLNTIIEALSNELKQYPFMNDKLQEYGIVVYVNEKLISQETINKAKLKNLIEKIENTINSKNSHDFKELRGYIQAYLQSSKKLDKLTYRKKILSKTLQLKLKNEILISLPINKIKVFTVDLEKIKQDAKKSSSKLRSIIVKQSFETTTKNLAWKMPGYLLATSILIKKAIQGLMNPLNALSTSIFSFAIATMYSIHSTTLLNINRKLTKYGRWAKMLFSIIQGRVIEIAYRMIGAPGEHKNFEGNFVLKLFLNTIDNIVGTLKKDGLNTLVEKGYISRQKASILDSATKILSPISQIATGLSGNPAWDLIYTLTFVVKVVIVKLGIWSISKILPSQTALVILALGTDFNSFSKKEQTEIIKNFIKEYGFRIRGEGFLTKIPRLPQKEYLTKKMFLEYNLLQINKRIDLILENLHNNKEFILHPKTGLIPILAQNIGEFSISTKERVKEDIKNDLLPKLTTPRSKYKTTKLPSDLLNQYNDLTVKLVFLLKKVQTTFKDNINISTFNNIILIKNTLKKYISPMAIEEVAKGCKDHGILREIYYDPTLSQLIPYPTLITLRKELGIETNSTKDIDLLLNSVLLWCKSFN